MSSSYPALETLSFEQALSELESHVQKLESGRISLDEAISVYERGLLLKDYCGQKLNDAKMKIEKITFKTDGTVSRESLTESVTSSL